MLEGNHTLAGTCGIAVMAKASIPGRAKTRLVPPLTFTEASDFNTAFLRDVADNIVPPRAKPRSTATSPSGHPTP